MRKSMVSGEDFPKKTQQKISQSFFTGKSRDSRAIPSHHHCYSWYANHSQSWAVDIFVVSPTYHGYNAMLLKGALC
jgi:hypothetical protein